MLKTPIAIVGIDCRVPGASSAGQFWYNLQTKRNGILRLAGADKVGLHIAVGYLDDADRFAYEHFGLNRREASLLDPQHRLFIACAANALQYVRKCDHTSEGFGRRVGVFASCAMNTYLPYQKSNIDASLHTLEGLQATLQNDKDYIALHAAHLLNLSGPAVTVQASCSSSIAGAHLACLALNAGDCDLAVAGGATVMVPQLRPYRYIEGSIFSSDGQCRPFTKNSTGTVHGNGTAVVVLKRLDDAVRDRNPIFGVIISSAMNNDGNRKDGFTAPSAEGQREVIEQALRDIDIETIGLVEAHGTGTKLGDRIEIEGLTQAFSSKTGRKNYCALGTIKSGIGHLEATSAAASLVKVALCLCQKEIPSDLYEGEPIDFKDTPFYYPKACTPWAPVKQGKRRACISSFGMGGTNTHMVLEEPPPDLAGRIADLPEPKLKPSAQPRCWVRPQPDLSGSGLGALMTRTADESVFETYINANSYDWFQHHLIANAPVAPGTFFIYLLQAAVQSYGMSDSWVLRSIELKNPLKLSESRTLVRTIRRKQGVNWYLQVESRGLDAWEPLVHAVAEAVPVEPQTAENLPHLADLLRGKQEPLTVVTVYEKQSRANMYHGPSFQKIRHAVRTPQGILGVIADFDNQLLRDVDRRVCLLDSCLQLFRFAHGEDHAGPNHGYLLTALQTLELADLAWRPGQGLWCLAQPRPAAQENSFTTDFIFFSEDGDVLGTIRGAREKKLTFQSSTLDGAEAAAAEKVESSKGPTRQDLVELLKKTIAESLGLAETDMNPSDTLEVLGLDSFAILEIGLIIEKHLNQSIDPNDLQRDSTLEDIADRLALHLKSGK